MAQLFQTVGRGVDKVWRAIAASDFDVQPGTRLARRAARLERYAARRSCQATGDTYYDWNHIAQTCAIVRASEHDKARARGHFRVEW